MRGGAQNQREHPKILIKYVAVHPMVVSENYSSSGMLRILIKAQTVYIFSSLPLSCSRVNFLNYVFLIFRKVFDKIVDMVDVLYIP